MTWAAVSGFAVGGATLVSGYMGAQAAGNAADAQSAAAQAGIAQQQQQFEALQKLLSPYVQAGNGALTGQQNLLGLNGSDQQQQAINGLQSSPMFSALSQQGENSILANASATGGLRGGNVQGALAQFRPNLLNAMIDQQYSRLGGMAGLGQNSAAGVGNAGMQSANSVSNLLQQQGAAQAGGALADGRAWQSVPQGMASALGVFSGMGGKF